MISTSISKVIFSANATARSKSAVTRIAKAKQAIESLGFKIETKGTSSGSNGIYKVFVYPASINLAEGSRNDESLAFHTFNVRYMKGAWRSSETAHAESMVHGLADTIERIMENTGETLKLLRA